jgi:hypothetical protein
VLLFSANSKTVEGVYRGDRDMLLLAIGVNNVCGIIKNPINAGFLFLLGLRKADRLLLFCNNLLYSH